METFVLLPFFLLCRVSTDADSWRHGPEYTFVINHNTTHKDIKIDSSCYLVNTMIKCRPRDLETMHCRMTMGDFNGGINGTDGDLVEVQEDKKNSSYNEFFDMKFDRRGIQSILWPRYQGPWGLDMVLLFMNQLNIGVDLRHKPDDGGAFNATERSYILGECNTLVNISSMDKNNKISGTEDYEIVTTENSVLKKKRGEVLVIEKTTDLEDCLHNRNYIKTGKEKNCNKETVKETSRSRIEISDMGYDSYTESTDSRIRTKISMNLISVRPAQEALEPFLNDTQFPSTLIPISIFQL